MKHFFHLLPLLFLAGSCGPAGYALMMDSRQPSPSGIEMGGKSMSIVYLESEDGADSLYNSKVSEALATGLEEEYFSGEQAIGIYKVTRRPGADYSVKDTLVNYVMSLDTDIVMLLDTPETVSSDADKVMTRRSNLYVYDAAGRDEVVRLNCDLKNAKQPFTANAGKVGKNLSLPLLSEWKTESYTLIYFDGFDFRWQTALVYAEQMKWDQAISKWMEILSSNDSRMRSSAMYNIAMGCYMMKEYELADEWLKKSDETHVLSLSAGMHKRIDAAVEAASHK